MGGDHYTRCEFQYPLRVNSLSSRLQPIANDALAAFQYPLRVNSLSSGSCVQGTISCAAFQYPLRVNSLSSARSRSKGPAGVGFSTLYGSIA